MKKSIFKGLLIVAVAMTLVGCGKSTGRTLTSATGSVYECLVVINDEPLTQDQLQEVGKHALVNEASGYTEPIATLYDLVEAVMGADMPCMPQVEPYFRVTKVSAALFDDMFKPTRNILFVDINPQKYTQLKAKVSNDYWSTPQAICRIQSPSKEEFVAYCLEDRACFFIGARAIESRLSFDLLIDKPLANLLAFLQPIGHKRFCRR